MRLRPRGSSASTRVGTSGTLIRPIPISDEVRARASRIVYESVSRDPRTNSDFGPTAHIQAIANTAAFHFGFIEQAGTRLYATLSRKVSSAQVLDTQHW
jgi:hypothetical protein